jgi:hypothetical protein
MIRNTTILQQHFHTLTQSFTSSFLSFFFSFFFFYLTDTPSDPLLSPNQLSNSAVDSIFSLTIKFMQLNIADYPVQKLVHIVSDLLESIIITNDELMIDTPLTHFHSRAKPGISIHAYLTRILKFAPFSNEALLSLLVYFDRIALKQHYAVNSFNVHRLLITR